MPDITPNLSLKKPLGTEAVSRVAYNENLDLLDSNATPLTSFDAHLAENVSYVVVVTRDSSLTGIQTVTLPFKAKSINVVAFKSKGFSNGFWAENNTQRAMAQREDGLGLVGSIQVIVIYDTATKYTNGTIQNVTNTGFEINWANAESPTGTITIYISASTHGGA